MKTLFVEAPYEGNVELSEEVVNHIKNTNYSKAGLYSSVQFVNKLDPIKKKLEDNGIKVITSKPSRADKKGQLLGCNVYGVNLDEDVDCYLYVGDGKFHPLALVYSQKDKEKFKEVICYDPVQKKVSVLKENDIEKQLKRYKGSLVKFHSAKNVGVIITLKSGQEQYKIALKLKEKYPDKKFYYFVDNNISFDQLENFTFVEVWVNTACPRIALDEQEMFVKGVVNINDVLSM